MHARAKFIPRAGSQKDEEILQITWQKLIKIEQPNVCAAFISEHKDCIIWVDFRASNQTVKKVVAQKYSSMSRPCFVLETTGKLRGFALSENFVIAGTAAMSVFPHTAVNQVTSLGLNFFNQRRQRYY